MTYRNDTEAENLRLKAELESAKAELETLKEKYLPKPEQVEKDRARYELESLLVPVEPLKGYYPPNITNRSFLDMFRSSDPYTKSWLGFAAILVIFTISQIGVIVLLAFL